MNIIGTGLSGLVGSRIVTLLSDYTFENLSLETGVDITDKQVVEKRIFQSDAPWVFHFAAVTDVDGAEKERGQGTRGKTWTVNVTATEHVVGACKRAGKRLLYISTDFVFDGKKKSYSEEDVPKPGGWYAITKYEGEKRVAALSAQSLIIRIANPYSAYPGGKKDFVHKIIELLQNGQTIKAPADQIFVPTFIDDIAGAIDRLVRNGSSGIFHVVGSTALSPFDAAVEITRRFGFSDTKVKKTTFKEYFSGRAPRPLRAALKNDKITGLGVHMSSFDEGLEKVHAENKE